jgi:predicted nucleic acid-binding protein
MGCRIFLDADVLIAAFQGEAQLRSCAQAFLNEPLFDFIYDPLLHMEVMIQPTYHGHNLEVSFYNTYFRGATCFGQLDRMFEIGSKEAMRHGIAVADALHIATAHISKCAALVTAEKDTKPMFRTKLVRVISIRNMTKPAADVRGLLTG